MALSLKDAETDKLAREVAKLTGESLTEAVRKALAERLERERRKRASQGLAERLEGEPGRVALHQHRAELVHTVGALALRGDHDQHLGLHAEGDERLGAVERAVVEARLDRPRVGAAQLGRRERSQALGLQGGDQPASGALVAGAEGPREAIGPCARPNGGQDRLGDRQCPQLRSPPIRGRHEPSNSRRICSPCSSSRGGGSPTLGVAPSIRIGLASSKQIRDWSSGEVTKPETIN